jgi:pyruvate kinase
MRLTKIVATLGPATSTPEGVRGLVAAGASVVRLNCSHLSTDNLRGNIKMVRDACSTVAILVDIQGPKLRFTHDDMTLIDGEDLEFTLSELGIESSSRGGSRGIQEGHRILMDDGRLETVVSSVNSDHIRVQVVRGGLLKRGKGVNLPDTEISGGVLAEKDLADLKVAREMGVEIVAVSFVQSPSDIITVRELVGDSILVFAKIERPQALERIDEICAVSDGVMAARGDLGVETPFESVPAAQSRIALSALERGVISICATEMLESMISATRPTRAEVADVSGAVRDGFDAVMLSGETAVGANPNQTVKVMAQICEAAEKRVALPNYYADANPQAAAVTAAASALAKRISADLILSVTFTGFSARLLASCRPSCAIVAATPGVDRARRLQVCRGVYPMEVPRDGNITTAIATAIKTARENDLVKSGDTIVVCASRLNPRSDADTILLHVEN